MKNDDSRINLAGKKTSLKLKDSAGIPYADIPKQPSSFKIVKEGVTSSNRDFMASGESKDKDEIMDRTGSYESPSNQLNERIMDKWDKEVVGEAEVFDRLKKYPTQYGLSQANKTQIASPSQSLAEHKQMTGADITKMSKSNTKETSGEVSSATMWS